MSSRIDHFDRAANTFGQQQTLNGQFFLSGDYHTDMYSLYSYRQSVFSKNCDDKRDVISSAR